MDRVELACRLGADTAAVHEGASRTVIVTRDPVAFRTQFTEAVASGGLVFLADPSWGERERAQFNILVDAADLGPADGRGWLMIPTGGSSGRIKLARHDETTIGAAVAGFAGHFGGGMVNALGVLPLHHVSGLMAWLRCGLTGGVYADGDWGAITAGRYPLDTEGRILSLVPTQLARLLGDPSAEAWLRTFKAVFIGGGPSWPALIEQAATARLPLAFSYGMTESAAMVAALRPAEFLAGQRGSGKALPHAHLMIGEEGDIAIKAPSLFRGYWPKCESIETWVPGDVGSWDADGNLHVAGRRDALIITGGEKVNPVEVEAALREAGAPSAVTVIGLPDPRWGEAVVACFPAEEADLAAAERWSAELAARLARFKWPKRYVPIKDWPASAAGKVDRARLRSLAAVDPGGEVRR